MRCKRNGYYFASATISIISAILLATSLGTPNWVETDIERRIQKSIPNSTVEVVNAGFKYFGLFRGCEEKKYAPYFAPRNRCFDAFSEIRLVVRTDLAYVTLICSCLALSLIILSIYIAFYNELVHSVQLYTETSVPFATLSLSIVLKFTALGAFLYMFNANLKLSLLSKTDLADGFSTLGKARLGYSFWLMVTSIPITLSSLLVICISYQRKRSMLKSNRERNNVRQTTNDIPIQAGESDGTGMMIF